MQADFLDTLGSVDRRCVLLLQVGTNRRYGERRDEQTINRQAEQRLVEPASLSPRELDIGHDPVRHGDGAHPVRAWVTFADGQTARIYGTAREWTSRAVHVDWSVGEGEHRDAWVWASAVERLKH